MKNKISLSIKNENIKFKIIPLIFDEKDIESVFYEKNNKTLKQTFDHHKYSRLQLLLTDKYKTHLDKNLGDFLKLLHSVGYQYLTGIEPYLTDSIQLGTHFHLIKGNLHSINSNFDLIRLHHVFEHVSDPVTTLNQIYQLLDDEGIVVLTIPIADYVFSKYNHNAYLIQAPHHFQLFTISGIIKLVEKNNFIIKSVFRNAKGISNWIYISELWKRNITQHEANQSAKSILSKEEMLQFKQQEAELIKMSKGDNVTLILSKQH